DPGAARRHARRRARGGQDGRGRPRRRRPADRDRPPGTRAPRAVSATAAPPTDGTACPRCGAHVAPDQSWCLRCGDAARTRLVPTPNWRLPIAIVGFVCTLALLVIAISFVQLTRDDAPVTPTTPAATTATTPPPVTTAPP